MISFLGSALILVGLGTITSSLLIGIAAFVAGTAVTFPIKPALGAYAARRIARASEIVDREQAPKGFRSSSHAERRLKSQTNSNSMREEQKDLDERP